MIGVIRPATIQSPLELLFPSRDSSAVPAMGRRLFTLDLHSIPMIALDSLHELSRLLDVNCGKAASAMERLCCFPLTTITSTCFHDGNKSTRITKHHGLLRLPTITDCFSIPNIASHPIRMLNPITFARRATGGSLKPYISIVLPFRICPAMIVNHAAPYLGY